MPDIKYYEATKYDIEAMAKELGLEPEYRESATRDGVDYISSTLKSNGQYEYHYIVYTSEDYSYSVSKKYQYKEISSEADE